MPPAGAHPVGDRRGTRRNALQYITSKITFFQLQLFFFQQELSHDIF